MNVIDLGRLTDVDFEAVCKDLFEEILGIRLEIFAAGRDRGIDLRGHDLDGRQVVVQCKHWWRSSRDALLRYVRDVEVPKVRAMDSVRYLIATSCDLTVNAKDRLVEALAPHTVAEDIYGGAEIAAELRKRPHIVQRHVRLWLNSAEPLRALLTKDQLERSRDLVGRIDQTLRVFQPGRSYHTARRILEANRVCVVSGGPGMGKTSLAHALAASHAAVGCDVVDISEDAREMNEVWDDERPQFFLYDDFLGRAGNERVRHGAVARLLGAITRVAMSPGKYLVLTTREYVLARARDLDELLFEADLDSTKCVLSLEEYTPPVRARILYNHVYFSILSDAEKAAFAEPAAYEPIVRHPAFNPRLLAMGLRAVEKDPKGSRDPATAVLGYLNDSSRLWWHIVENQLDDAAVDLFALVFSQGTVSIDVGTLEEVWTAYRCHVGRSTDARLFRRALRALDGTLVRIIANLPGGTFVELHNPSVWDFAVAYFLDQPQVVGALLDSAVHFSQIEGIWEVAFWESGPVHPCLIRNAAAAARALVRTYDSPTEPGRCQCLFRASYAVDFLHRLPAPELAEFVRDRLAEIELRFAVDEVTDHSPEDYDDLGLLLASIVAGGDALRPLLSEVLLPAIERIVPDYEDWPWVIERLARALHEFAGALPLDVRDALETAIRQTVETAAERWAAHTSDLCVRDWRMIRVWADERSLPLPADVPSDDQPADGDPKSLLADLWARAGRWSRPMPEDNDPETPSSILSRLNVRVWRAADLGP